MNLVTFFLVVAFLLTVGSFVPWRGREYSGGAALLLVIIVGLMEHWK